MFCLELLQYLPQINANFPQIEAGGTASGNYGIICRIEPLLVQPVAFPDKSLYTIAHYSPANLTAGGNPYPRRTDRALQSDNNKISAGYPASFPAESKKLLATEQAFCLGKRMDRFFPIQLLGCNRNGKPLAAFGAAALDYQTSIFSGHTDKKSVCPLPGSITRLKCSFHLPTP